jgi:D-sedoheptulose 7-phosphate isomerase
MTSPHRAYIDSYFRECEEIIQKIDRGEIEKTIEILKKVRDAKGRLFIIGVGGGAGNAGHAVNDFRKLGGMEAYAPTDNASELTARVNDDGWESVFAAWLKGSRLSGKDALMVFSVGGGNLEKNISPNIVRALQLAKEVGAAVVGVVGKNGGYTKEVADACVVVPMVNAETVTPLTESFQAVVWHAIVSHPGFRVQEGKWESVSKK